MKHLRIDRNFIKMEIKESGTSLSYVLTTDQITKVFTKVAVSRDVKRVAPPGPALDGLSYGPTHHYSNKLGRAGQKKLGPLPGPARWDLMLFPTFLVHLFFFNYVIIY